MFLCSWRGSNSGIESSARHSTNLSHPFMPPSPSIRFVRLGKVCKQSLPKILTHFLRARPMQKPENACLSKYADSMDVMFAPSNRSAVDLKADFWLNWTNQEGLIGVKQGQRKWTHFRQQFRQCTCIAYVVHLVKPQHFHQHIAFFETCFSSSSSSFSNRLLC